MKPLACLVALLASAAPARPEGFAAFADSFPELRLPLASGEQPVGAVLPPELAWTWLFAPLAEGGASPTLRPLADLGRERAKFLGSAARAPCDPGLQEGEYGLELRRVGRLPRKDATALIVRVRVCGPYTDGRSDWLLLFTPAGVLVDGLRLSSEIANGFASSTLEATVDAQGRVRQEAVEESMLVFDADSFREIRVRMRLAWKIDGAKLVRAEFAYQDLEGRYRDPRMKEELVLLVREGALHAWYRRAPGAKEQKLAIGAGDLAAGRATVRFAGSAKDYRLEADASRNSIACRNPDGTKQTFAREIEGFLAIAPAPGR